MRSGAHDRDRQRRRRDTGPRAQSDHRGHPRRTARRVPDKVAIIDGDVALTFAEFDALVDRVAAALHANGLAPGDRVALLSRNSWQYAVLAFATARAAVVLVPVNFMLTGEEIAYILGHCRADAFIAAAEFVATAAEAIEVAGTAPVRVSINQDGSTPTPGGSTSTTGCTTTTRCPSR